MVRSLLAGLACLALCAPLAAADEIEDAIEARQGYFKLVGLNFGPLVGMARGRIDYDPAAAQASVDNLAALGSMNLTALFPAGSDADARPGETRARPEIWTNLADVLEKHAAFRDAVAAAQPVAGDGRDALAGALGPIGRSCGACHDAYRTD